MELFIKEGDVHDFMFMGYCDGIRMYKNRRTRHYLHLDTQRRTYRWKEDHYEPIGVEEAIAQTFDDFERLSDPAP